MIKSYLDAQFDFTLSRKEKGGVGLKLGRRSVTKYDVSRGGFDAALDLGSEGLDSAFGGKYKGFRDSMKGLLELTFDKVMQDAEEVQQK